MSYENLTIDAPVEGVARVTFNRPERLNALTHGLVSDLHDALSAAEADCIGLVSAVVPDDDLMDTCLGGAAKD
ncbi:hypothetical protein [Candidatus Poriferisodalis sp.]|uniref:hypothetical protein n=1 Tax=Candidatus Poriferisodalis sp. TaxID=3101277 RepID=UPI003C703355